MKWKSQIVTSNNADNKEDGRSWSQIVTLK